MIARLASILLLPVLLRGCWQPQAQDANSVQQSEAAIPLREPIEPVTLALPPVSTFEASCANCHGPQGSFFGDEFGELPDAQLHDAVQDMMEGPAFLKPSDADLRAMVAYHRALAAKEPFLCVTAFHLSSEGRPAGLEGEAAPGAAVSLAGAGTVPATAGETGTWQLRGIPSSAPLILVAEKDGKTTRLDLHQSQWSHQSP